jgi:hypothetical protein
LGLLVTGILRLSLKRLGTDHLHIRFQFYQFRISHLQQQNFRQGIRWLYQPRIQVEVVLHAVEVDQPDNGQQGVARIKGLCMMVCCNSAVQGGGCPNGS